MTKMGNVYNYAADCMTLSGKLEAADGYAILDAMSVGIKALDILSRVELDLSTWEGQKAKELLDEWN